MKKLKRLTAVILIFALLAGLSCCTDNASETDEVTADTTEQQTEAEPADAQTACIGYNASRSLNPFKTQSSINAAVCTLVYDSLYETDSSFKPTARLAQSAEVSEDGVEVTLLPSVYFSDGSELSASDVTASFYAAKESTVYSDRLKNITSAAAQSGDKVVFTLESADAYALSCLDFPIASASSLDDERPVGSGRYVLVGQDDGARLRANESYSLDEQMSLERIELVDLNSDDSEMYRLQIGDLTFLYSDMRSDRDNVIINASAVSVPTSSLVFMGINSQSPALSEQDIRLAVCTAVDRQALIFSVYNSYASLPTAAFNSSWYALEGIDSQPIEASKASAARLLEDAGYYYEYETNEFRSRGFEYLELSVIVNEDNEDNLAAARQICSDLKQVGIDAELYSLEREEYLSRLESGEFDLYVGEIKLGANMSLNAFFDSNGSASRGISEDDAAKSAYFNMMQGKTDVETFVRVFEQTLPFFPLCYRTGTAYYSHLISFEGEVSENSPFSNIYSWSFN